MLVKVMETLSRYAIPVMVLGIPLFGAYKRVKVYECFIDGAKEGFEIAVRVIPHLVAMLSAIAVFRASGALELLAALIGPVTSLIGMPPEVLPMALMRPLSGSGANGVMNELFKTYGPDSLIGTMAAVMSGSSETTFYVLAVYFGAVAIKKTRHAIAAGLVADVAGFLAAVAVTNMLFR